jgi:nucleoid-associated protein YgaU
MKCPICQKAGLADDASHCPQCNSDLSGLHRLRNISVATAPVAEARITDVPSKSTNKTPAVLLGAAALLFVSAVVLFWRKPNDTNLYGATNIESVRSANDSLNAIIVAMSKENKVDKTANSPEKSQTTPYIYVAKKGDNLARIAHYFYGNASAYPQILKDNNLPDNYLLLVGDTLTLKLNR